jgi:hypothetical protein
VPIPFPKDGEDNIFRAIPISKNVPRGQTPLRWPISWLDWTDQCCSTYRLSSHQTLDRSVTSSQGLAVRTEIWEGIDHIHVGKNTGFLGLWTMRSLINHWARGRLGYVKRDQQRYQIHENWLQTGNDGHNLMHAEGLQGGDPKT